MGGLTGPRPESGPVERCLVTMRRAVGQLSALGPVGRARLDRDPATGLVIERVLALLADLSFEINRHVAAAVLGAAAQTPAAALAAADDRARPDTPAAALAAADDRARPDTPAAALAAAVRAGLIDEPLAAALDPPDGPYHVQVQLYLDTEPEQVAGVVSAAVAGYAEYVRQVTGWTSAAAA